MCVCLGVRGVKIHVIILCNDTYDDDYAGSLCTYIICKQMEEVHTHIHTYVPS